MRNRRQRLTAIRPFPQLNVPEAELDDLRRRIKATRWPTSELVADDSQGVQLATTQALAPYWATDYDWRKIEAKLNAIPQFVTEIDGQDIQFIHVRSKHDNALPLIITHGWPGSIIEQMKVIGPLTDPTAHGASASDAFHLVIPSMPGYGYLARADHTRLGSDTHCQSLGRADAAARIQPVRRAGRRLGCGRHATAGVARAARTCSAFTRNMPGTVPADILAEGNCQRSAAGRARGRRAARVSSN